MTYCIQGSPWEHESMLSTCLSKWGSCEQDMYIVSSQGHRVYTSQTLLAFSSPHLLADILPSSTETALSLPFSTDSIYVLCSLLSKGVAHSEAIIDTAEVEQAAHCLGINLQLQETFTQHTSNISGYFCSSFYIH